MIILLFFLLCPALAIVLLLAGLSSRQKKQIRIARAAQIATEDLIAISAVPQEERQAVLNERREARKREAILHNVLRASIALIVIWALFDWTTPSRNAPQQSLKATVTSIPTAPETITIAPSRRGVDSSREAVCQRRYAEAVKARAVLWRAFMDKCEKETVQ